jgi:hypothetical protein
MFKQFCQISGVFYTQKTKDLFINFSMLKSQFVVDKIEFFKNNYSFLDFLIQLILRRFIAIFFRHFAEQKYLTVPSLFTKVNPLGTS